MQCGLPTRRNGGRIGYQRQRRADRRLQVSSRVLGHAVVLLSDLPRAASVGMPAVFRGR
jgi:hypothetical protein